MTVCLFTVHMLFPAALAAMSSLHSKQPECTWAIGCSQGANTPKLWGAPGWLPHTWHRPGDHVPAGLGAQGCGHCWSALPAQQGEAERVGEGVGWGEGSIGQQPPGTRSGYAQPAVAKAMVLHRHSELRRPHRSQVRSTRMRRSARMQNCGSNRLSAGRGRACPPCTEPVLTNTGLACNLPHSHMGSVGRTHRQSLRELWHRGRRGTAGPGQGSQHLAGGRPGGGKIPGEAKINRASAGRSRARWLT